MVRDGGVARRLLLATGGAGGQDSDSGAGVGMTADAGAGGVGVGGGHGAFVADRAVERGVQLHGEHGRV